MFSQKYGRYSSHKFQEEMKKLWEENAKATYQLINHILQDSPNTQTWVSHFSNNQQRIANGVIKFYGNKEIDGHKISISLIFTQQIQFIANATAIFQWKKDVNAFRRKWYEKMDELMLVLNEICEFNTREFFYNQITFIEGLIKSFIKNEKEAQEFYYRELILNNEKLAVTLSQGIIRKNTQKFNG